MFILLLLFFLLSVLLHEVCRVGFRAIMDLLLLLFLFHPFYASLAAPFPNRICFYSPLSFFFRWGREVRERASKRATDGQQHPLIISLLGSWLARVLFRVGGGAVGSRCSCLKYAKGRNGRSARRRCRVERAHFLFSLSTASHYPAWQ